MKNTKTTDKVNKLRQIYTDVVLCEKIGITRPTFYNRLKLHNWKVSEVFLIKNLT